MCLTYFQTFKIAARWIFAESQPRSFVSFRLGEDSNGQPTQSAEEEMDTSHIVQDFPDHISILSNGIIEVYELVVSSPEPTEVTEGAPNVGVSTPMVLPEPQLKQETSTSLLLAEIYKRGGFPSAFSSSGSDECINAYCP